jgi:hypothetical protein
MSLCVLKIIRLFSNQIKHQLAHFHPEFTTPKSANQVLKKNRAGVSVKNEIYNQIKFLEIVFR